MKFSFITITISRANPELAKGARSDGTFARAICAIILGANNLHLSPSPPLRKKILWKSPHLVILAEIQNNAFADF